MIVRWKLPAYLTQKETRQLFSVIKSPRDRALFLTIYLYGLRVSEACLLHRDDVDLERRRIRIWRVKNGNSGEKPLFRKLVPILRSYLRARNDDNEVLFVGRQGRLSKRWVQELFHPLRNAGEPPAQSEARTLPTARNRDSSSRRRRADRLRAGPPRSPL